MNNPPATGYAPSARSASGDQQQNALPPIIKNGNDEFKVGQFLGKGGFARCFAVKHDKTNQVVACKIVSKTLLVKRYQKEKMIQEIRIHRRLKHTHIVKFFSHFEDDDNVYVLLELCKRRSLMEVVKRRGKLTYHEARFFMHQLMGGVHYLHGLKIIHRDLKLGNLFLTEDIQLKIGDFGLATVLGSDQERRRTLCGTPNYIAPEILEKSGHSYEVDIWSCGCILYTLLVGKPPFESPDIRETYDKIKNANYEINPALIPQTHANSMIKAMLQKKPEQRPMAQALLEHQFFVESSLPTALPESILTTAPRLKTTRPVLKEIDATPSSNATSSSKASKDSDSEKEQFDAANQLMSSLEEQLQALMDSGYAETDLLPMDRDAAADPASMPVYWVTKWVDYTEKYGLGYQLCDNSLAVIFNDNSRMVLLGTDQMHFIDHRNQESYHTLKTFPKNLQKKVVLLKYFRQYMHQHLMTAGADAPAPNAMNVARLPYLRLWFRTQSAIVFLLSNGTLQLNFFKDHTKIILCPLMGAVSYIDKNKNFRTYSLKTMHKSCPTELSVRLKYALTICAKVRENLVESRKAPEGHFDKK